MQHEIILHVGSLHGGLKQTLYHFKLLVDKQHSIKANLVIYFNVFTDFIPNKDKDNSLDPVNDKGPYDMTEKTDTSKVSSGLIDNRTIKDKWDKGPKKRNIVNEFDEKDKVVHADVDGLLHEEKTSLSAEETIREHESETPVHEADTLKKYALNSEDKINNESALNTEEPELNTEQRTENEESEFQPQTLTDATEETEEQSETSLEHSESESKTDLQPVQELDEDSIQNNVDVFDPREEEFEILTEENEGQIGNEESENNNFEYNEEEIVDTEVSEEDRNVETEDNESELEENEPNNSFNEDELVEELNPETEEDEMQKEAIEEEYVEVNAESEIIESETDEGEMEIENEDNASVADTNEWENQTEGPVSSSDNEDIKDQDVHKAKELDLNVDLPPFMTDLHWQEKDPELVVNSIPAEKMDPACHLPPVTGFCKAAFRRFYFNSETGECQTFIFGGCGGNENNFETMEECMRTCSKSTV